MKRFETFLGNEFRAWVADADTKLSHNKAGRVVTVVRTVRPDGEKPYDLKTTFNLDVLPAYSIA